MSRDHTSLRWLIAKWFGVDDARRLRIRRLRGPGLQCGCVLAEIADSARPLAIIFFRHEPGCWRVFPPAPERAR